MIHEVAELEVRLLPIDEERPGTWSSSSWTFRAFAEEQIEEVLEVLTSIDHWIDSLYPEESRDALVEHLRDWWWEVEALTQAVLAGTPRAQLLKLLVRRSGSGVWAVLGDTDPFTSFKFDVEDLSGHLPVESALDLIRRARPVGEEASSPMGEPWLHLLRARRSGEDDEEEAIAAAILKRTPEQTPNDLPFRALSGQLVLARAFRVEARLSKDFCRSLWQDCELILAELAHHPFAMPRYRLLRIYESARQLALSLPGEPPSEGLRKHYTLHGALWADPRKKSSGSWPEPAVMPAIGLPIRVVLAMLIEALHRLVEALACSPRKHSGSLPELPVWCFSKTAWEILRAGRRLQLGLDEERFQKPREIKGRWFQIQSGRDAWEIPAHATFYLPWALGWVGSDDAQNLWSHILLFQTAVDGSERSLDAILDYGIGSVPLTERWGLRSRVPVPEEVWDELDSLLRVFGFRFGGGEEDRVQILATIVGMSDCLAKLLKQQPVSSDDFLWERIDVRLELANSFEVPYGISRFTASKKELPFREKFEVIEDDLAESFTVRLGQIRRGPDWLELPKRFPGLSRAEIQRIMKEVAEVLGPDSDPEDSDSPEDEDAPLSGPASKPSLIVLPEISIPRSEVRSLIHVSSQQEVAIFAGLLWRAVPPVVPPHGAAKGTRWIANEALLVVPLKIRDDRGPALSRHFYVEKPIPAHMEHALARRLSERSPGGQEWRVLAGRRWYRFVHPSWGEFTVAICSDLIDSTPWAALRGEILHLLMCAHNQDIGLYESLTWTRAYENYVNVVAVNSGEYGGSMAWSPKRHRQNEVARLLGNELSVTADVHLVVRDLWKRQFEDQRDQVVEEHLEFWRTGKEGERDLFKSPPPGFPFRKKRNS